MDKKLFRSILWIITYAAILILIITNFDELRTFFADFFGLFTPLVLGFALAFVLNRPCQWFLRLYRRGLGGTRGERACLPLAVCSSYLVLIFAIFALFSFIIPRFIASIQHFVSSLEGYMSNIQTALNTLTAELHLEQSPDLSGINNILNDVFSWAVEMLTDALPQLLSLTGTIVSAVVTGVLALAFSIYMLSGRDRLLRQCRRLYDAYMPKKIAGPLLDVVHLTADTFSRFVVGQIIEACIIGGLCAAGMLFIQPDYAALIGVLVGCTALIPVVGAYVGAIVSALLLLVVSPVKALIFLIFLVILQQIEGNVIYPRVVGSSIGLPGIWVLTAVTVGAGIGGIPGVLLSVPVASVLYTLLRRDVHRRLDSPAKTKPSDGPANEPPIP